MVATGDVDRSKERPGQGGGDPAPAWPDQLWGLDASVLAAVCRL